MTRLLIAAALMLFAVLPAQAQTTPPPAPPPAVVVVPAADLIVSMDFTRGANSTPAGFVIKYLGTDQSVIDCLAIAESGTPENARFSLALIEMVAASLAAKEGGTADIACDAIELVPTPVVATAPTLIFPPALD